MKHRTSTYSFIHIHAIAKKKADDIYCHRSLYIQNAEKVKQSHLQDFQRKHDSRQFFWISGTIGSKEKDTIEQCLFSCNLN